MENELEQKNSIEVVKQWDSLEEYITSSDPSPVKPLLGRHLTELPIRADIRESIALCLLNLASMFDADKDDEPYFYSDYRTDGTGILYHSIPIGIPHVVGRCLLGAMVGEEKTGIPFSSKGMSILEYYCKVSFDNPEYLNVYIDPNRNNQRFIEFHSMREGLYGLVALIRLQKSDWARETADKMLATLDALTDETGVWSTELAGKMGILELCEGMHIMNACRMVEPLLEFYRCTSSPLAIKLAEQYAYKGLETGFTTKGLFTPVEISTGHIHTITSSLAGIAEYAIHTGDSGMLDAVRLIMDNGVPKYFSTWGWGDEVMPEHPADVKSRGEINQTGDVVRTALKLGAAGYTEYYELAERFLRSMLLPTQHRENELKVFMHENEHPQNDAERNVLRRTIGGFSMQLPNDRMREGNWPLSTLDITSGAVHALSECWQHIVVSDEVSDKVNLFFNYENDDLIIKTDMPIRGSINFIIKKSKRLFIRIPEWVNRETIRLTVDHKQQSVAVDKGYIDAGLMEAGQQCNLLFNVPIKIERETVDGIRYKTMWLGNQNIEINPRGTVSPLPF